jgi:hypothetical protein
MPVDVRLKERYTWCLSLIFRAKWLNRDNRFNQTLLDLLVLYLNPFEYFIRLRKMLNGKLRNNELYK